MNTIHFNFYTKEKNFKYETFKKRVKYKYKIKEYVEIFNIKKNRWEIDMIIYFFGSEEKIDEVKNVWAKDLVEMLTSYELI